jgi:hypothetical protein
MGKEGFDRCIDTATSGFFLLVEDQLQQWL